MTKKRFITGLKYVFAVIMLVSCFMMLTGCVSQDAYEELKSNLQTSENILAETKSSLVRYTDELNSTFSTLQSTRQVLEETQKRLADAESKLKLYQDTLGITIYSGIQPLYYKTPSQKDPINIAENPAAADPTWEQLVTFLKSDTTDSQPYIDGKFMCGAFAERVQNNAENAGINCALVAINFSNAEIGHALNAVKTIDKGLVFVDCTGQGYQKKSGDEGQLYSSWDKIAYIEKTKEYGVLGITADSSTSYSFYEEALAGWDTFQQQLAAYNAEVDRFNDEIAGNVYYIGTPEWQRVKQWKSDLEQQSEAIDSLRANLIPMWDPLGTVTSIEIYW
jgi:hypothetical protein